MSSGCIRLLNEDVIDLYNRVNLGTKVVVLPDGRRSGPADVAERSYERTPAVPAYMNDRVTTYEIRPSVGVPGYRSSSTYGSSASRLY